jgi:hypothetical protein
MPTPELYNKIASKGAAYKRHFLGIFGFGFMLILFSVFIQQSISLNLLPLLGIGFIMLIWGWGLFLVVQWFGSDAKKHSKLPQILRSGFHWYVAIFLDIWFFVGSIAAIQVLL